MPVNEGRHQALTVLFLLMALAITAWAYSPGLGGDFHFDDRRNLAGLAEVEDARSALEFVVSGGAGPLGRPIALASFLINQPAWPHDPADFLQTNILIHLLNGLLVAWLTLRLCMAGGMRLPGAGYAATVTAGLWSALPILASASLLIGQRMTLLAATFCLLGLAAYLLCREALDSRPRLALAGMSASLVGFTLLAVLTKENGALLPVFALVLEATLLSTPGSLTRRAWRTWQSLFLWLPLLVVLAALISRIPYTEGMVEFRGFTAWERLITEAVVLWQYLFNAFLPIDTGTLGPFQDTRTAYDSILQLPPLLAMAGWLATVAAAVSLRHRAPVLGFAVFWYLAGHLIESTVAPLELYFEHRNYLPLIGPVFGVAWIVVKAPVKLRWFSGMSAAVYMGLLAVTLALVTSTWGRPYQAATSQYEKNPRSERAIGYLFAHLYSLGAIQPATRLLDQSIQRDVAVQRYRLTWLFLACRHGPEISGAPDNRAMARELKDAPYDSRLPRVLFLLAEQSERSGCRSARLQDIDRLVEALHGNPRYRRHNAARYWIHRIKAKVEQGMGNREAVKRHLHKAIEYDFDPHLLGQLSTLHARDGEVARACQTIKKLGAATALSPTRRVYLHLATNRLLENIRSDYSEASGQTACRRL